MKVRIKFSKQGPMKFIGHLDVMRFFQKVMRRAEVNIRYSEGFSPHQIMSFAAPLGVGLTSNGEYLDIEVTDDETASPSSAVMVERLNAAMVEGIEVLSYRKLPDNAKNAMSIVAASRLHAAFPPRLRAGGPEGVLGEAGGISGASLHRDHKDYEEGEALVDIKPHIHEYRAGDDSLFIRLAAGSSANIKPELVLAAYSEQTGETFSPFAFQVQREEVYGEGMVPLEEFGEDIE